MYNFKNTSVGCILSNVCKQILTMNRAWETKDTANTGELEKLPDFLIIDISVKHKLWEV